MPPFLGPSSIVHVEDIDEKVFMWEHLFSPVADSHALNNIGM